MDWTLVKRLMVVPQITLISVTLDIGIHAMSKRPKMCLSVLDFPPDPLPFLGVRFCKNCRKRKSSEGHFVLIGLHLAKWSLPMSEQLCH